MYPGFLLRLNKTAARPATETIQFRKCPKG
jgi:hypothetical protein